MTVNVRLLAEWAGACIAIGTILAFCLRWLDGRIKLLLKEVDLSCEKRIAASMAAFDKMLTDRVRDHDRDENAHVNHSSNARFFGFVDERRRQSDGISQHMAVQDISLTEIKTELRTLIGEFSRLREAHDEAIKAGVCVYQHQQTGRGRA